MRSNAFLKSNRTTLTVAPVPSVASFYLWIILKRANTGLDLGIAPYWFGSTLRSTAGFTNSFTM